MKPKKIKKLSPKDLAKDQFKQINEKVDNLLIMLESMENEAKRHKTIQHD